MACTDQKHCRVWSYYAGESEDHVARQQRPLVSGLGLWLQCLRAVTNAPGMRAKPAANTKWQVHAFMFSCAGRHTRELGMHKQHLQGALAQELPPQLCACEHGGFGLRGAQCGDRRGSPCGLSHG